jgi:hypothetical protein
MSNVKRQYKIEFLPGNHGVWLFVSIDDKLAFEQSGLTLEDAFKFAKQFIESSEK